MDTYHIWCDLKDTTRDLEFATSLERYLGRLRKGGLIEGYRLSRRKLGFGPDELGEFHVAIDVKNLAQLDEAFGHVAARADPVESIHRAVYDAVTNFRSALYRDFPDPQRLAASKGGRSR